MLRIIANTINPDNGGGESIGAPFVGDIYNDNEPEISVARKNRSVMLKYNGTATL